MHFSCLSLPFFSLNLLLFLAVASACFFSDPITHTTLELFSFRIWIQLHHRSFPGFSLSLVWLLCPKQRLSIASFCSLLLATSYRLKYMIKICLLGSLSTVIFCSCYFCLPFFLHESFSVIHLKSTYLSCCFSFGDPFPGRPCLSLFSLLLN